MPRRSSCSRACLVFCAPLSRRAALLARQRRWAHIEASVRSHCSLAWQNSPTAFFSTLVALARCQHCQHACALTPSEHLESDKVKKSLLLPRIAAVASESVPCDVRSIMLDGRAR
eukprot:scaffold92187_cov31-Tisochrysis_lutea.AAC.3